MSDLRLALLRELAAADEACSTELAELEALAAEIAAVRERADALATLLAGADRERARLAAELADAEAEREERAEAAQAAATELAAAEAARDDGRLAAARRFHVRANDALLVATRRAGGARDALAAFDDQIAAAERETPQVEKRARNVAASLRGRPRVAEQANRVAGSGLGGVAEWASGARAALFVARTAVAGEREALIRQANELGSALLGEPLFGSSPAAVARRVEATLGP